MSIEHQDFREQVVRPVLARMALVRPSMQSKAAEDLLVGTAAHETRLGRWLMQHPGPARGVYQIEPVTFNDLLRWLQGRSDLLECLTEWASPAVPLGAQLAGNLYFATAVARMNYYRKPFAMPADPTIQQLAAIWKKWWNTELGKGTVEQYLRHYLELAT